MQRKTKTTHNRVAIIKQKNYVRRPIHLELLLALLLIALLAFIHYRIKNLYSEFFELLVSGFVIGFVLNDVRKQLPEKDFIRKIWIGVLVFATVAWVIAVVFDPLLKPWLDTLFGVNTVGSFRLSVIANSVCFGGFVFGLVGGWKVRGPSKKFSKK